MSRPPPFAHQTACYEIARGREVYAYLLEQGCGKTRIEIDVAFDLYERGEIDALVVLAPNGVHMNWVLEELPTHAPNDNWKAVAWKSTAASRKWFQKDLAALLAFDGLAILTVNIDAITTKGCRAYLEKFLAARRVRMGVDEVTVIKTPKAKRTRTAITLGKRAVSRWIMTGTPITQGPLDLFAPFRFLDPAILGFNTYTAFKNTYGIWREGFNGKTGMNFKQLVGYRNIGELKTAIAPHSFRVTKDDCLDLPPKLYETRYFDLSPETQRIYNQLREELLLEIADELIPVPLMITRLLRLQQLICGEERLNALAQLMESITGKTIIWARFTEDIDRIMAAWPGVRYDGSVKQDDRAQAVHDFQNDPNVTVFVGNPHAGGRGITLHAATNVVYFSNDYSLETRLQSEDRAHRIGQHHAVTYYDLIALGTVDEKIVKSLRDKRDVATTFMEDLKKLLI